MLIATTPPITPPATATVVWAALLFGLGTALTAEFVDPVFVPAAAGLSVGAGATPIVVKRGAGAALSVSTGEADISGRAVAGETATESATEAVMLLSA